MTADTSIAPRPPRRMSLTRIGAVVAALAVVAAIALDTTVVRIGSEADTRKAGFSPETFGAETFPGIRDAIVAKAVPAAELAAAIAADKAAATEKYGVKAGTGAIFSVRLSGVAGEAKSGVYPVTVEGLPEGVGVRVQTGPAINGTELRDATGTVAFGQFTNQIEYQNAGAALNNEMKKQVLAAVDTKALSGKTIEVVGAFRLVNPKNWLVTPVELVVK